ncbi:uncharacterized protein LOC127734665 isoform X1 [Mytilus californianus]|uniref:uncharacterized protein LOC127734665 isoform X1 n=1 Tax=Mytilus californianus TaxID=6549 RepID=UPI0022485E0A|nr:uncharacterized protein LOC127734665 isoform X1 [Mytilus californianus]
MKYPEHKLSMETALPSSVQSWLGNELEIRGIDSVIYSRYIIHLLLEDHDEECMEYLELFFNPRLDVKSKVKRRRCSRSQEEKKKKAAIECLQAVSDENCGIEKLVEELCTKLKELSQSSGSDDTDQGDSTPSLSDGSSSELEDPAERYYAAFPALTGQNEKSPTFENCLHMSSIWKDNPWTKEPPDKQLAKMNKYKKAPKQKYERKQRKKSSPNSANLKKQTPEKPIPKPKYKPNENFHARFMSWPQSEFVPVNILDKQTNEEKKLCQQVENILKEMLLHGHDKKFKERFDIDGFISPELQENAFWYTKQFAELITPVESGQRLYERHSCPFFHNNDVFIDPDKVSIEDEKEQVPQDDQFGLQDLMKNQELQTVAESVLQNVDEDFSKKEDVQEVQAEGPYDMHKDIGGLLLLDGEILQPNTSPYDNQGDFPVIGLNQHEDLWSTLVNQSENKLICQPGRNWKDENISQMEHQNLYDCPVFQSLENQIGNADEVSLPSWMFSANKTEMDCYGCDETAGQENENYSQLWDINIWNKQQRENGMFLDGFNSTFDDFKSGLNQLPDKGNRNSGVFNINLINEGLESFDLLEGDNINTLIPKITFELDDLDESTHEHKDDDQQNFPRTYDRSISLTDVHLLKSLRDNQLASTDKLSKSFELIPSNNSAFKDVIPRKMTHVQSDSNICYFNYSTLIDFEDNVPKVQNEEKNENLYLSPKTHFRPISAKVEEDLSDLHLRDLFGGYSSSTTPYQKFQEVTDSGDEDSFIPMFKVCKQHDKNIQTGSSFDDQPENNEKMSCEDKGRPPEVVKEEEEEDIEFIQDFDVYGYVDSLTASAQNTPQNVLDVACNTCFDSGYEEANDDEKVQEEKSNWLTVNESHRLRKAKTMEWHHPEKKEEKVPADNQDLWGEKWSHPQKNEEPMENQDLWGENWSQPQKKEEPMENKDLWGEKWSQLQKNEELMENQDLWGDKCSQSQKKEEPMENQNLWGEKWSRLQKNEEQTENQDLWGENCSQPQKNEELTENQDLWGEKYSQQQNNEDLTSNIDVWVEKWPSQQKNEDEAPQDNPDFWGVNESEHDGEIGCSIQENVWSSTDDSNFPDMFSFFTEDCDDLKPQETTAVHAPPCYLFDAVYSESEKCREIPSKDNDVTKVHLVIGKGKKVLQDIENCPRDNSVSEPIYVKGYMPMPRVAVYSCELEKEWLDKESPKSNGKSSKFGKLLHRCMHYASMVCADFSGLPEAELGPLYRSGRKPCTFFMEGSCKRSDCKFSHDLSNITCRFWEEGDCFKGDLCPFLHSYYVSEIPVDIKENVDDYFEFQEEEFPQLSNQSKRQKQKILKSEKSNTFVESRKIYRTNGSKQKSVKLTEKNEN